MLQTRVAEQLVYLHTGDCGHHSAIKVSVERRHEFGYTVSTLLLFLTSLSLSPSLCRLCNSCLESLIDFSFSPTLCTVICLRTVVSPQIGGGV